MKILVTGGLGFVGRHVSHELLKRGHDVHIIDNLFPGSGGMPLEKIHKRFDFELEDAKVIIGDVRDETLWINGNYDALIHLAAIVGGRQTIEKEPLSVAEDLEIDSKIIRLWHKGLFGHLTYLSSSASYPINLQKNSGYRLKETDIDFADNLGIPDLTYGWAKLSGEYLIEVAKQIGSETATILRPFSGYGIDQDLAYPFPSILKRVRDFDGKDFFYVWGSGLQERDFIYIDDLAIYISTFTEKKLNMTLNLCTGIGTNFIQLASEMLRISGNDNIPVRGREDMPFGVMSRIGDPKVLNETLISLNLKTPRSVYEVISDKYTEWKNVEL